MILLLDNYDSFTYNLYQFIAGVESEISGIQKDQTRAEGVGGRKGRGDGGMGKRRYG